jgi:hypothetical protein
MTIGGYDITKGSVPEISRIWTFNQMGAKRVHRYIVPAGRYRFEEITSESDDQRLTRTMISNKVELMYKPRFSFYVTKGKVNYLGVISLIFTENKDNPKVFPMQSSERNVEAYYIFSQVANVDELSKFKEEYDVLFKQTSGHIYQEIILKPWNRTYDEADPLKRSPQFENGYNKVNWHTTFSLAKNFLDNFHQTPKIQVVSANRFIDNTSDKEVAIYDFNTIDKVQYPLNGLFKVTIIRAETYEATLERLKNLYGVYNQEEGKTVWRLVNNRVTLEKHSDKSSRITIVSMEYIRKLSERNPEMMKILNPEDSDLKPRALSGS